MPTAAPFSRMPRGTILLALILAGAGCTHTGIRTGEAAIQDAAQQAPAPPAWWRDSGDPLLNRLIERGLAIGSASDCTISALRERAASTETLGKRLKRFFEPGSADRAEKQWGALLSRAARRRAAGAEQIALAYLEARRLGDIRTLRATLLKQYGDNAEIAEFRRQAGLVPAIDGAIAGTQEEAARAELGRMDGRFQDALALLARLTGEEPATLAAQLAEGETRPYPFAPPPVDDTAPATSLSEALKAARRTVADARLAYREGAGTLATLYVSEAASLSVEAALIDARAGVAADEIHKASARSQLWAADDVERMALAPPPASAPTEDASACD